MFQLSLKVKNAIKTKNMGVIAFNVLVTLVLYAILIVSIMLGKPVEVITGIIYKLQQMGS